MYANPLTFHCRSGGGWGTVGWQIIPAGKHLRDSVSESTEHLYKNALRAVAAYRSHSQGIPRHGFHPAFANPCTVHRKTGSYFVSIHRERLQFLGQRLEQAMRDMLLSSFCMQPRQRHAPCRKLKSRSNSSPKNMQLAATSSSQARFLCCTAGRLLAVACNIHR